MCFFLVLFCFLFFIWLNYEKKLFVEFEWYLFLSVLGQFTCSVSVLGKFTCYCYLRMKSSLILHTWKVHRFWSWVQGKFTCSYCVLWKLTCSDHVHWESLLVLTLCTRKVHLFCLCMPDTFTCSDLVYGACSLVLTQCTWKVHLFWPCVQGMFTCSDPVYRESSLVAVMTLCTGKFYFYLTVYRESLLVLTLCKEKVHLFWPCVQGKFLVLSVYMASSLVLSVYRASSLVQTLYAGRAYLFWHYSLGTFTSSDYLYFKSSLSLTLCTRVYHNLVYRCMLWTVICVGETCVCETEILLV